MMSRHVRLGLFLLVGLLALAPLFGGSHTRSVGIFMLMYAFLSLAWNLIGGIAGQLSLGHAAWFGIGAYTSTLLFLRLGISPWLGMWVGAALATVVSVLIGMPSFRLRGAYFALATVATVMILKIMTENSHQLLGGPRGLNVTLLRHAPWQFQFVDNRAYYIIGLVLVAVGLLINWAVLRSRFGYYLTAIRNDEEAASALGIDTRRCKLLALAISAALTAIGGTFYAQYMLYIHPDKVLDVNLSLQMAVMCIVGGRGTLWGPVIGAAVLIPAEELARRVSGGLVGADVILYGILLMVVIGYEPKGLHELGRRAWRRLTMTARPREVES